MKNLNSELKEIIKSVKAYMELEARAGVNEFLLPVKSAAELQKRTESSLENLELEVLSCKNCQLHKTRTNVVFGSGNPKVQLVFVGEAPGYEEDMQGLPFVGRAGKLLTKIIEAMIRDKRFSFAREKPLRVFTPKFSPPKKLKTEDMGLLFAEVLKRLEPIVNLPREVIKRTITITEKINQIRDYILEKVSFNFKKLLNNGGNKTEVVVSFLAILELVKQRTIEVDQIEMFDEIEIRKLGAKD